SETQQSPENVGLCPADTLRERSSNARLAVRAETLLQRWLPNLHNFMFFALTEPYWHIDSII
ncbi:hypothetical protein, partial [Brasilonema octagenarum]|uniref:hypothetical protein n=1 Tax=Brasilonema octagenarum TaxID=417105 RepID=UPI001B7D0BE1